jgi:biopolymer transport protein ExbB
MIRIFSLKSCLLAVLMMFASGLSAAETASLDGLLKQVQQSIQQTEAQEQARLDEFLAQYRKQANLLKDAKQRLAQAEAEQARLKREYDDNEKSLRTQQDELTARTGQLGEVFGVIKQQGQDLSGVIQDSLISSEFPNRLDAIAFADQKRIPSLSDVKGLWLLMLQEMTATSEIKRFSASVAQPNGVYQETSVLRVGPFVAIDQAGRFLAYDASSQQLEVFPRQPDAGYLAQAQAFFEGKATTLLMDPSRGNLLELIGRTPTLKERLEQGGPIGFIILALGALGVLLAIWRLLAVLLAELKIKAQSKRLDQLSEANPLGRVLQAVDSAKQDAHEVTSIEVRLDEALLKEVPRLERGMSALKLLAAVAPLLGLLGTVTGMIGTFQSITVFGTSDPKLMAGGISQALITTVLGLCVAIPLLFCHSLVADRVRRLVQLLQQVAFASLAESMESGKFSQSLVGSVQAKASSASEPKDQSVSKTQEVADVV